MCPSRKKGCYHQSIPSRDETQVKMRVTMRDAKYRKKKRVRGNVCHGPGTSASREKSTPPLQSPTETAPAQDALRDGKPRSRCARGETPRRQCEPQEPDDRYMRRTRIPPQAARPAPHPPTRLCVEQPPARPNRWVHSPKPIPLRASHSQRSSHPVGR